VIGTLSAQAKGSIVRDKNIGCHYVATAEEYITASAPAQWSAPLHAIGYFT